MSRHEKDYIIYEGEQVVALGTINQISQETGLSRSTIKDYISRPGKKRQGYIIEEDEYASCKVYQK